MRALDRKLARDVWRMRGQLLAIALLFASGIAVWILSFSTLASLSASRASYYADTRFADVFARLERAPESLVGRIAEIPGVATVDARIAAPAKLTVAGFGEPISGLLLSVPEQPPPELNALHLRAGRWIEPGRPGEAIVSEAFADAHGLELGEHLEAVVDGRLERLVLVGVALSPEYVYAIPPGASFPDDARFGVLWLSRRELEAAFDMKGAFNDVSLALTRTASEGEVIDRLDALLEPYGGLGAYPRRDQVSDFYLSGEIGQLRGMGLMVPSVFLGVASFLLSIVMRRLIETDRPEIATLKALGYRNGTIGRHYLGMVAAVIVAGSAIGVALGARLASGMISLYTSFFRFPSLEAVLPAWVVSSGVVFGATACVLGTLSAVRHATRLEPAQAMRPPAPPTYRRLLVDRLGAARVLAPPERMVLRQLERRPGRAALTVLGIALAEALLVLGHFGADAFDFMIDVQFGVASREDASVTFTNPRSRRVLTELRHLPGVLEVELDRTVPVRMSAGHRSRRIAIIGLERDARLTRLVDREVRIVDLPAEGVALSRKLAEILGVERGEQVLVEVLDGERQQRWLPVTRIVDEFFGISAYMEISALNRALGEGASASGARLTVDPAREGALHRALVGTPGVAGVTLQRTALQGFRESIADMMVRTSAVNAAFAMVIAFGVVYNGARVALSERARELGTLRVLGFTRREISVILLGELALLTAIAIPLGLAIGAGLARWMSVAVETELYRFPFVVSPSTVGRSVLTILVATALSAWAVERRLHRMDLVAVLKSRET